MANRYVDNAATASSPYTTWGGAADLLADVAAIDTAGDAIYIASTHTQAALGAAMTLAFAGTNASPTKIVVGTPPDTGDTPPTTIGSGVEIATGAGNYSLAINGALYCYGLNFKCAVGGSSASEFRLSQSGAFQQTYEMCEFWLSSTSTSAFFLLGSDGIVCSQINWINCKVKFAATTQKFYLYSVGFHWNGGSLASGSSALTTLFTPYRQGPVLVENVDLSGLASTAALVGLASWTMPGIITFRNCKLPASWSGTLVTGTWSYTGQRVKMHNCDDGDTNYALWEEDYAGSVRDETTIKVTAGASDGTTVISWKMVSSANAEFPAVVFYSPEIVTWNETVGSSVTLTVEFLIDSATTLNNNDVWMEVNYNGTSGNPLGVLDMDSKVADVLTAATECTAGAGVGSWSGESGTAKSYKLTSTFTPQEKGFFIARVALAKASTTIYVNPVLTVS